MSESKRTIGSELQRRIKKVLESLADVLTAPPAEPVRVPVPVPVHHPRRPRSP